MDFNYDFASLGIGIAVVIAGALVVIFYKWIADNLAEGVSSYEKVKTFGVIAIIIGLVLISNLHTAILTLIVNWIVN